MTDEQREALQERLKELDGACDVILKARRPFDQALGAINGIRYSLLAEAGVEPLDESCAGCGRHFFVGDLGHRCSDGPVLCEKCAPTWNDLKEHFATGGGDDPVAYDHLNRDDVAGRISAGDGDKKHVWLL